MDPWVPAWWGRGDPTDDERSLFSTFKPLGDDNTAKPGPNATPAQPQGAEKPPPAHPNAAGGVPPGPQPPPPGWSSPEGDPRPELVALRTRTRLWFEQTQAGRLVAEGELPVWFHGFISRRETEELLQDEPPGCFLVRFSESTVGFVLSYRGRDRCRHFVLDQLPDGRYVILGERSAHAELADLLRHYAAAPVAPYHEFLTVPYGRAEEAQGGTKNPRDALAKGTPRARQAAADPPAERREAPRVPPPLPVKSSSSAAAAQGPRSPGGPYARGREEGEEGVATEPPDAKYQQLMCFHTYAEPHEGGGAGEPIPFYAVGRGCGPDGEENVYSEVTQARQDPPPARGARGGFSTLLPKARAQRRLFRSVSSQNFRKLPAAPGEERGGSSLAAEAQSRSRFPPPLPADPPRCAAKPEFDDPVYSRMARAAKRAAGGQVGPENVYEQLAGDRV